MGISGSIRRRCFHWHEVQIQVKIKKQIQKHIQIQIQIQIQRMGSIRRGCLGWNYGRTCSPQLIAVANKDNKQTNKQTKATNKETKKEHNKYQVLSIAITVVSNIIFFIFIVTNNSISNGICLLIRRKRDDNLLFTFCSPQRNFCLLEKDRDVDG